MTNSWLDDIEAQADDTVPYYLPRLIATIRAQEAHLTAAQATIPHLQALVEEWRRRASTHDELAAGYEADAAKNPPLHHLVQVTKMWYAHANIADTLRGSADQVAALMSAIPATRAPQEEEDLSRVDRTGSQSAVVPHRNEG